MGRAECVVVVVVCVVVRVVDVNAVVFVDVMLVELVSTSIVTVV